MLKCTETAIKAVLAVDTTVSQEERNRVFALLNNEQEDEKLITMPDVVKILGVSRQQVHKYVRAGYLSRSDCKGRNGKYKLSDVRAFAGLKSGRIA